MEVEKPRKNTRNSCVNMSDSVFVDSMTQVLLAPPSTEVGHSSPHVGTLSKQVSVESLF